MDDFSEHRLAQWCELYNRLILDDAHHLGQLIASCSNQDFQRYLCTKDTVSNILNQGITTNDDYLNAYGCLIQLEQRYQQMPTASLLHGIIEKTVRNQRYVLVKHEASAINKAIPEKSRFKPAAKLGTQGFIKLCYHWLKVENSTQFDCRRSDSLNALLTRKHMKIGFAPLANHEEMQWQYDADDLRADGRMPFWCANAQNEPELVNKITLALATAYQQKIDILLLPELIVTEALLTAIQAWLLQHNAFEPVIRLIVAGSRHIHHGNKRNEFSNCCTILNAFGDIEWQQEKRQPFNLTEREAHKLLNHKQAAFEPTQLANTVTLRLTALGLTATPICLDFFHDSLWKDLPIQVLLVPAMSPNLDRFHQHCTHVGKRHLSSAFICNAEPNDQEKSVYAYIPSKDAKKGLTIAGDLPLFTVEIEIDMN